MGGETPPSHRGECDAAAGVESGAASPHDATPMQGLLVAGLLALTVGAGAGAADLQPVDAKAVASTARIESGMPFDVGVMLQVQHGWHVYWLNPGDSGLATSVRWTGPEGFEIGPLRWPVPHRFEQPGGGVGYGYADAVLLRTTVTPPRSLPATEAIALRADVGWLACQHVCIRGKRSLTLTIGGPDGAEAVDAGLFAEWAARFPLDTGDPGAPASVAVRGGIPADGRAGTVTVTLDWTVTPAGIEWFPPDDAGLAVQDATSDTDGTRTTLTFRAKRVPGEQVTAPVLESVVAWTDPKGARHGLRVPIDLDGKET
jgi:DsbC/DsbD-like thiol-disulfide interchange protein